MADVHSFGFVAAWVGSPTFPLWCHRHPHRHPRRCYSSSLLLADNGQESEYRSIAEVVGGLHGGKYQFGGDSIGGVSDAFSGHGGGYGEFGAKAKDEAGEIEELLNWAKKLAPDNDAPLLRVPSNANPMDGMVYFASIDIQNQERTWEKFYAKVMTNQDGSMTMSSGGIPTTGRGGDFAAGAAAFVEVDAAVCHLSISPRSGSLAPRGGASNACDASDPYSDTATIRVTQTTQTQSPDGSIVPPTTKSGESESTSDRERESDLWLVVGTEEEQWTYKLDLLEI